jgi:hypothetical protein
VIVCEVHGASWAPFRPLGEFKGSNGRGSHEAIWTFGHSADYAHAMATTPVDALLAQLRETLKEELRAEVRAEIIAELQGGSKSVAKPKGKAGAKPAPKASAAKTPDPTSLLTVIPGQRRTESDIAGAAGEITAYLKKNPGSRVDQIAASFGVAVKDLQLPIAWLLKHKRVTKKGKLRGTTYTAK